MEQCRICQHPERRVIDIAIGQGKALAQLAQRFSISEDSLSRHRRDHVDEVRAIQEIDSKDLLITLLASKANAEQVYQAATDPKTKLEALREIRQTTDSIAKLIGAHRPIDPKLLIPAWMSLKKRLLEAVKKHPEAREDILLALEEVEIIK